jgi:hypothetical protein
VRELRIENIEKVKRIRELMLKRGGEVGKDEKIRITRLRIGLSQSSNPSPSYLLVFSHFPSSLQH